MKYFPRGRLLAASFVIVWPALNTDVLAAMGDASAQAGFNAPVIVEFPGIASASDSGESQGNTFSSNAIASPSGLQIMVTSRGYSPSGGRYQAGASFSSVEDSEFNYEPDFQGGQSDWVQFQLSGALSGSIVGQGIGGAGGAEARLNIFGPIYNAPNGSLVGSAGDFFQTGGVFVTPNADSMSESFNETLSTGFFWFRRGDRIGLSASMNACAAGGRDQFGNRGTVVSNFSDTFKFDPREVFEIVTPGITVNPPSFGGVRGQGSGTVDLSR